MAETLKNGEIAIEKKLLITLYNQLENQKAEIRALYDGSIKVLSLIGLAENGRVKTEAFEEGGNAMPEILKGAGSIMSLVMQSQVPIIGKKAEQKLIEKFDFFKHLIPMFIKYGNEFNPPQTKENV